MSVVRWDPKYETVEILDGLERLLRRLEGRPEIASTGWLPEVRVTEDDEGVRVVVELPGVRAEDLSVELEDGLLLVKGERAPSRACAEEAPAEGCEPDFQQAVPLPPGLDLDKVVAEYEGGALEVTAPWL